MQSWNFTNGLLILGLRFLTFPWLELTSHDGPFPLKNFIAEQQVQCICFQEKKGSIFEGCLLQTATVLVHY